MLVVERHARILEVVQERHAVSTEDLAQALDVSSETIRRDLVLLGQQGAVRRVHGGAATRLAFSGAEVAFEDRTHFASEGKAAIGALAAGLVTSGQTLVFDVGTTVLEVARALPPTFVGTVATCSLLVAAELAGRPQIEVLVSAGRVRGGDLAVSNADTLRFFSDIHPDIAFLGSGGISAEAGLTDFYPDEVATRRVILANAARSYVLADSSKLDRVAPHRVCALEELSAVITDRQLPAALQGTADQAGIDILTPRTR
jgi:DeoR/GlpR family transcriptional regulator of sugar metabolism